MSLLPHTGVNNYGSTVIHSSTKKKTKGVTNPLTKKAVSGFYKDGQTWSSVFTSLASSFEECRAEAVGIYLCLEKEVLEIFGYTTEQEQQDIIYCNWLNMVHAGLVGLEFYSPESKKWGQAEIHASQLHSCLCSHLFCYDARLVFLVVLGFFGCCQVFLFLSGKCA